jgi:hypothetical protein
MQTALLVYLIGFAVFASALAIRIPYESVRICVMISALWPLSLIMLFAFVIVWTLKWDIDIANQRNPKMFAVRKPLDGWPGIAITVFHYEVQLWKKRA